MYDHVVHGAHSKMKPLTERAKIALGVTGQIAARTGDEAYDEDENLIDK